jgi:hypothetical protein
MPTNLAKLQILLMFCLISFSVQAKKAQLKYVIHYSDLRDGFYDKTTYSLVASRASHSGLISSSTLDKVFSSLQENCKDKPSDYDLRIQIQSPTGEVLYINSDSSFVTMKNRCTFPEDVRSKVIAEIKKAIQNKTIKRK